VRNGSVTFVESCYCVAAGSQVMVSNKVWLMDGSFSSWHCTSHPTTEYCTIIMMECCMIVFFYSVLYVRILLCTNLI
jgi:hypothetical protein